MVTPDEFLPERGVTTPREILELAEREGVEVRVRYGRLAYRGSSPQLEALLKAHERDVVEALGYRFRSPIVAGI